MDKYDEVEEGQYDRVEEASTTGWWSRMVRRRKEKSIIASLLDFITEVHEEQISSVRV